MRIYVLSQVGAKSQQFDLLGQVDPDLGTNDYKSGEEGLKHIVYSKRIRTGEPPFLVQINIDIISDGRDMLSFQRISDILRGMGRVLFQGLKSYHDQRWVNI